MVYPSQGDILPYVHCMLMLSILLKKMLLLVSSAGLPVPFHTPRIYIGSSQYIHVVYFHLIPSLSHSVSCKFKVIAVSLPSKANTIILFSLQVFSHSITTSWSDNVNPTI
jgi:hypothetical protein